MDPLPELKLDFNNSQPDGLLFARASRASAPLVEGGWVLARDFEGNECRARIVRIEDGLAYLAPDFESWKTVEDPDSTTEAEAGIIEYSFASSKRRFRYCVRRRQISQGTGASGSLVGVS